MSRNTKLAAVLAASVALSACSPLQRAERECASLGVSQDDERYFACLSWREQAHLQHGALFNQSLATGALIVQGMQGNHP